MYIRIVLNAKTPGLLQFRDGDAARGWDRLVNKERIKSNPPTQEELAHRQAVVAKMLANADKRGTSPVTSTELVQKVRPERDEAYERWTH